MKRLRRVNLLSASLAVFAFIVLAGAASIQAAVIYGVTGDNQLVRFDSATPSAVTTIGAITGLQSGENVLGIDFRPLNGQLYALGSSSRIYTIDLVSAQATAVGSPGAFTLSGTDFGFDFNPTVDRIRVVSNTGQNLRLNPANGALAATDGTLNPGTPGVNAAAYTNNSATATTTTLYDVDVASDSLFIQNPPNNGTLALVGALGVDMSGTNGFDISPLDGTAYAALTVGGQTRLYTIDLGTGAASPVGTIGSGGSLRGIAVAFGNGVNATSIIDFDGDRRTDYTVFRLTENTWYVNRSTTGTFFGVPFGLAESDVFTPADFDGDGKTDIAVWRTTNGVFYVLQSSNGTIRTYQFGLNGDEPVVRDYDGDAKADFAVVRRTGGTSVWYINNSSDNAFRAVPFGFNTDIVAPGDYDGDRKFDIAVRRGSGNEPAVFFQLRSTEGFAAVPWGLGSDLVVPGDYDGDGRTDLTALRAGTQYTWYTLLSRTNSFAAPQFGGKPHIATQGDYDGDGRTNVSVWDPTDGRFYVLSPNGGSVRQDVFGLPGDTPVAAFDTH